VNNNVIYAAIRQTVESFIPGSRIILFGSRAKGRSNDVSDYDLLVITSNSLTQQEKIDWSTRIDRAIVKTIKAPVNLLLYSEDEVRQKQNLPGNIVRTAMREGIAI
jgi:predicted nucleotidyltransferase